MKHTIQRLLAAAIALELIALVVAYSLKDAREGAAEVAGAIAWFTLFGNGLLVLVLAAATIALALRRRGSVGPATR